VGQDVAEPFRARFGSRIVHRGRLDLWAALEQALLRAGAAQVARTDLCTACHPELFFSHRRDGPSTGRQGAVALVA
jgi:copper oxidase (laccase) domain-containing protein